VDTREDLQRSRKREGEGMRLVSVYERPNTAKILYDLLCEREPRQNIRHTGMPSFEEHCAFLRSKPYQGWYLIDDCGGSIGSVYLSKRDEIGIFIFNGHQGKGWGARAIAELKRLHPRPRFLANIAIPNAESLAFFTKQGFHLLSITMEFRAITMEFRAGERCSTALPEIAEKVA
jgi:RimJ/RimL family protein N-acetyltransferase